MTDNILQLQAIDMSLLNIKETTNLISYTPLFDLAKVPYLTRHPDKISNNLVGFRTTLESVLIQVLNNLNISFTIGSTSSSNTVTSTVQPTV